MVMHDTEMNKLIEFNSGSPNLGTLFDLKKASKLVQDARNKKMSY